MAIDHSISHIISSEDENLMEPSADFQEHLRVGNELMLSGEEIDKVRVALLQRKISPSDLDLAMLQIRKNYFARKRKRGTALVLIGSILLVFGCIFTMVMHSYGFQINYILYIPTTTGIGLLLWGMINVMGW